MNMPEAGELLYMRAGRAGVYTKYVTRDEAPNPLHPPDDLLIRLPEGVTPTARTL